MDIDNVDNFDDVRRRSHSLNNISSRSVSLVSRASSRLYHEKIIINNNLPNEEIVEFIDRSQLSYSGDGQERNCVSMATDLIPLQGPQHVSNEALALNICNVPHVSDDNVINIQLPYDSNWLMESEL